MTSIDIETKKLRWVWFQSRPVALQIKQRSNKWIVDFSIEHITKSFFVSDLQPLKHFIVLNKQDDDIIFEYMG